MHWRHCSSLKSVWKQGESCLELLFSITETMDSRDLCAFVAVKINHSLAVLMVASPQKEEEFYTVSWAVGDNGSPLLACSGSNGVIRIVDCGKGSFLKVRITSWLSHPSSLWLISCCGRTNRLDICCSNVLWANFLFGASELYWAWRLCQWASHSDTEALSYCISKQGTSLLFFHSLLGPFLHFGTLCVRIQTSNVDVL